MSTYNNNLKPPRNRVIYQSEALFISPDTTGHHVFFDPKFTGTLANCTVTGLAATGTDQKLYFNFCSGQLNSAQDFGSATHIANYKYATFDCNTNERMDTGNNLKMKEYHPVLTLAGFSGGVGPLQNDNALLNAHIKNTSFASGSYGTAVEQLKRVQSANYSFTINRQDINQFGHLGRLESVVLEAPTVNLDFSYYLTDGHNERLLGFSTNGLFQNLSGIMTRTQNDFGNNYFILTVPEGRDAVIGDTLVEDTDKSVIGIGNAYITDYSIEASVGAFPTASVTVEAMNIKSDIGTVGKSTPAIDPQDGSLNCERCFYLPPSITGLGQSVLKPGDITVDLRDSSLISRQISGESLGYGPEDAGSAHIQSFTLSTPMGRTDLQRIGSTYAYAKEVDFPVTATLTVNALVADLKSGNLVNLLCGKHYDMSIKMQPPKCVECDPNDNKPAITIDFRKALLDSESFSSSIGDNKTVDLTFSTQIGGPEEKGVGVFFSGWENSIHSTTENKWKHPPQIEADNDGVLKYFKYGLAGTTGVFGTSGDYDNRY
jgi:hypothetical protein